MVFKNYSQKNRPINPRDTMVPDRGIISFFARHKVAANLLMAVLILYGAFGITQLKRQLMPDFGLELISVDVEWQGASAEDVESNVINAISQKSDSSMASRQLTPPPWRAELRSIFLLKKG